VMRELLAGLVPGLSMPVAKAIVVRADGIPLYAVETVRMLLAEGRLKEEDGVYRPVGDLTTLAIPETLTALIAARLDNLDPVERSVLQDAAVLGQSFTVAGLGAVTGGDAETLEPTLRVLVRRELLTVNADPRSPERGQYGFVQALIREVAYNQLARPERKARHLAAARWLETLGDDQLAGALAGQYAAAYRNAPEGPAANALAAQARIALRGAAERAAALGSHAQALAFLTQALEITKDPPERAALFERAGQEAVDGGIDGEARPLLDQAMSLYRELGDRLGVARAATGLSLVLHERYQPGQAIPILEAAIAETVGLETEPDVIRLLAELARAYGNTRHPRALEVADRVLELAEPLDLMPVIAEALINRALVLTYAGRFHEPTAILRGILPIAEAHGLVRAHIRALNNLASLSWDDDIRGADELTRRAIELARRAGAHEWLTYFQAGLALTKLFLGEWEELERLLAELDESEVSRSNTVDIGQVKAMYHAFKGDEERAVATLDEILPTIATLTHVDISVFTKMVEALVDAFAGRLEKAYEGAATGAKADSTSAVHCAEWATRAALWLGDARRAHLGLESHEGQPQRGRAIGTIRIQLRAGVDALDGRRAEALAGYGDAVARWRDLELPVHLGLCLLEFTILVGPQEPEARAAADEARAIWTRLGSPPLLARLDAGLVRWGSGGEAAPVPSTATTSTPASARNAEPVEGVESPAVG